MSSNHAATSGVKNAQRQDAVAARQAQAKRSDRRATMKDQRSI